MFALSVQKSLVWVALGLTFRKCRFQKNGLNAVVLRPQFRDVGSLRRSDGIGRLVSWGVYCSLDS